MIVAITRLFLLMASIAFWVILASLAFSKIARGQETQGQNIWTEATAIILPWRALIGPEGWEPAQICFVNCEHAQPPEVWQPENRFGCYDLPPPRRGEFRGEVQVPLRPKICIRAVSVASGGTVSYASEDWIEPCGLNAMRQLCTAGKWWEALVAWFATPVEDRGPRPERPPRDLENEP